MSRDDLQLLQGTLDVLVLKTVSRGPCHGYEIARWIRETTVYDLLGNRTHLAFSDLEPNAAAPADRFRFDPPAGVRVLKLDAEAPR